MTTLTNSEGKVLTYTNEFIETILLQLSSSHIYHTTGDDNTLFIKMGSKKALLLEDTYHIKRTVFQNFTINENTINDYNLEFILNTTSNEYTLQGVYDANTYIGSITELSQVFLAIYDAEVSPSTYTGSGHIDITDNRISINFPLKVNAEVVLKTQEIMMELFSKWVLVLIIYFSTKRIPWCSTNRSILCIYGIMYISWRLSGSKYL